MKQYFTYEDEQYWYDPETGEHNFDGDNGIIRGTLESMDQFTEMETRTAFGVDEHPGEMWSKSSPSDTREKVNYSIKWLSGVELGEFDEEG
jgi:hypothetical protein